MPIAEGKAAPAFSLESTEGKKISLKDFRGKSAVVLYFYPKDNTPGCTTEACDFRDLNAEIRKAGAATLGVSPDSIASHEKFIGKHELNFTLLSDPGHKVHEKYGAWGEKKNYGKTYDGVIRSTVLIDKNGKVARHWRKVKVKGHAQEVLEAAEALP